MSGIVKLQSENVKRLKAVSITPDGNLVIIGGDNAQGKSSVLDSIQMALGGGKLTPSKPIREGKKKAEIVAELDDIIVTRTFTKKTSLLTVRRKDGSVCTSPQKLLDDLVGSLSFDPLEFSRMPAKKQAEVLREIAGLDFSGIEAERATAFAQRTDVNRDLKKSQAIQDETDFFPDAPKEAVSVSALVAEWDAAQEHNRQIQEAEGERVRTQSALAAAQLAFAEAQDAVNCAKAKHTRAEQELSAFSAPTDTAPLSAQIENAEEINRQVAANVAKAKINKETAALAKQAAGLTATIADCDERKTTLLENATMPIEGLSLDDEYGVTMNGIPFDQCSQAEQLRISVSIGLAMNPKLPVLLIRDGSLLDEHNLAMLAETAKASNAQVWIERVGDKDKCAVIIEDGHIRDEEEDEADDHEDD